MCLNCLVKTNDCITNYFTEHDSRQFVLTSRLPYNSFSEIQIKINRFAVITILQFETDL